MSTFLIDLSGELIAFFTGLLLVRKLNTPFRLIYLQVFVAILVESTGFVIKCVTPSHHNAWLYNAFLPVDCGVLLWAAYQFIKLKSKIHPLLFVAAYAISLVVWLYCIIQNGWDEFAFISISVNAMLILVAYVLVLYYSIMFHPGKLIKLSVFWTCLGCILYYGCCIPYFSMYHYLATIMTASENHKLYNILLTLNYIRYLFLALSFYLYYKQHKSSE